MTTGHRHPQHGAMEAWMSDNSPLFDPNATRLEMVSEEAVNNI